MVGGHNGVLDSCRYGCVIDSWDCDYHSCSGGEETMKLNTTIAIPEDIKRELKARAAKDGHTMNATILSAIMLYLKNKRS